MKQILILAAAVLLAVSCSQKKAPKVLVLYYSQTNTTKVVAEEIANALGADLEAILPVVPYEGDIPAVAARCAKDAAEGKLPELKPFTVDVKTPTTSSSSAIRSGWAPTPRPWRPRSAR